MSEPETGLLRLHEDTPRFLEAVNATAATTGFAPRLIEKDYFCTLLLQYVTPLNGVLVFKGGTCLAKVHAGFYRLSEDLDFTIPTAVGATRGDRRGRVRSLKEAFATIEDRLPGVRLRQALRGANDSTQYTAMLTYASVLRDSEDTVKFEVGLREPLLTPTVQGEAKTLLLDPVSGAVLVPALRLPCLSREEAVAEKLRAALSRRDVAIRDFYDIDHAVRWLGLRLDDARMLDLVQQKLAMPGNDPPDVSAARLEALRAQVEAELAPVLRPADFAAFDLDRVWATVTGVAAAVG